MTSKAAQKVRTATRERRRSFTSTEIVETAKHGFTNTHPGSEHLIGIYRWVDRLDHIQLMNYGQRLMLGLTVPEPAAFLRWRTDHMAAQDPPPPDLKVWSGGVSRDLTPLDLTPANYLVWAAFAGAREVQPPPLRYKTHGLTLGSDTPPPENAETFAYLIKVNETVTVPTGYRPIRVRGTINTFDPPDYVVAASALKDHAPPMIGLWVANLEVAKSNWGAQPLARDATPVPFNKPIIGLASPLDGSKSDAKIPVLLHGTTVAAGFGAAIEFVFERTDDALLTWQTRVYADMMDAHKAALDEWRSGQRERTLGTLQFGDSPARKRQIERTELRRLCITLLSDTLPGVAASTASSNGTPPQIVRNQLDDLAEQARQFEDVFEWEHMSWRCLDYHYANPDSWATLSTQNDDDDGHRAFLSAGAAQVTLPVRPGMETLALFRLWRGVGWPGAKAPMPRTAAGLGFAGEFASSPAKPAEASVVPGSQWRERLPTTLVILQQLGDLTHDPNAQRPPPRLPGNDEGTSAATDSQPGALPEGQPPAPAAEAPATTQTAAAAAAPSRSRRKPASTKPRQPSGSPAARNRGRGAKA